MFGINALVESIGAIIGRNRKTSIDPNNLSIDVINTPVHSVSSARVTQWFGYRVLLHEVLLEIISG